MGRRLAPWAVPPKPPRFAIAMRLPRDRAGAVRKLNRRAVETDFFMEAAADVIGANLPPQRQRRFEQPSLQLGRQAAKIAHQIGIRLLGHMRRQCR